MSKTRLGLYLRELRIQSGAQSISEYIKKIDDLGISETYYRALESGNKKPAIETLLALANALGADLFRAFQLYLQDVLPPEVFTKLINPVVRQAPSASPKEALEKKDELIAAYRAALQNAGNTDLLDDAYLADDEIVQFLDDHFDLLPLVHFIYMADREISSEEMRRVCAANNITRDLSDVISLLHDNGIADVQPAGRTTFRIRRFCRVFRLPRTTKGKALRNRWMKYETERSMRDERSDQLGVAQTFSSAMISRYRRDCLGKVHERVNDLLAELHAASSPVDDDASFPFYAAVVISPRPEYGTSDGCAVISKKRARKALPPHQ
jgi:transcriptional regulator with XRE-family HTH domain